jgi:hypothetical protein
MLYHLFNGDSNGQNEQQGKRFVVIASFPPTQAGRTKQPPEKHPASRHMRRFLTPKTGASMLAFEKESKRRIQNLSETRSRGYRGSRP